MSLGEESAVIHVYDYDTLSNSLVTPIEDVFEVHSIRHQASGGVFGGPMAVARAGGGIQITGRLRVPSEEAFPRIAERFKSRGYVALLRKSGESDVIVALPGELPAARSRVGLALLLFLATLASVLFVGSTANPQAGIVAVLLSGWPFAASLLGILLAHEFGHYLVGRHLGVSSSLPYFIPMPLSFLGTLGAVIQMKAPPHNRRALLALAAAGPLAGLAVALPLLVLGLRLSSVEVIPMGGPYMQEGNSLLYTMVKVFMFGRLLPAGGLDVFLHPVAMAGWTGLLVTGLNLIPAGQLDGGHIAYALFGEKARWLTWAVIAVLLGLSLLWNGWLLWAGLVFAFGRVHAVPLDDVTPLRARERAVGLLLCLILVLVFTPIPIALQ
ncbi:MAG: site-2 protease family protein [Chloroflexi bacterium]|nr:site-2 protease family protein [Chloroflexota bacterium]